MLDLVPYILLCKPRRREAAGYSRRMRCDSEYQILEGESKIVPDINFSRQSLNISPWMALPSREEELLVQRQALAAKNAVDHAVMEPTE